MAMSRKETWLATIGVALGVMFAAGHVEQNLPGLSVAVGAGGDIVWAEGFGWADLDNRVPVAPGTRFRIGHASKALTSAAVGLLLEKDRLHLDDEIQTYVPAFPTKQWPVTLRQLMGHVAGVRHYRNEGDDMPLRRAVAGHTRWPGRSDAPTPCRVTAYTPEAVGELRSDVIVNIRRLIAAHEQQRTSPAAPFEHFQTNGRIHERSNPR
jgi:CubicO group peptidase (beta-lactamase class C family)